MFYLRILEYQWLYMAMLGGFGVLFLVVLFYLAIWKPREEDQEQIDLSRHQGPVGAWVRSFMPWFLITSIVGTFAFILAYVLWVSANPPNW